MRLWHKDLISILPREQLVSQWRECSAIAGAILKNGTPNHLLVNFVLDYDFDHFISYAYYIRKEMSSRGYRTTETVWNKIQSLKKDFTLLPLQEIYPTKMSMEYLMICGYNLYEKYTCGGISKEDWEKLTGNI